MVELPKPPHLNPWGVRYIEQGETKGRDFKTYISVSKSLNSNLWLSCSEAILGLWGMLQWRDPNYSDRPGVFIVRRIINTQAFSFFPSIRRTAPQAEIELK